MQTFWRVLAVIVAIIGVVSLRFVAFRSQDYLVYSAVTILGHGALIGLFLWLGRSK